MPLPPWVWRVSIILVAPVSGVEARWPHLNKDTLMPHRGLIAPIVLTAALCIAMADARADDALYPTWSGGWTRVRDGKRPDMNEARDGAHKGLAQ